MTKDQIEMTTSIMAKIRDVEQDLQILIEQVHSTQGDFLSFAFIGSEIMTKSIQHAQQTALIP